MTPMSNAFLSRTFSLTSRRRQGYVGVDLGTHSVKVARLVIAGKSKQIAEAAVIPLPTDARLTAQSIRDGWLVQVLKQVTNQFPRLRGQSCACGLSLSVTEFRTLTLPPGSTEERREMIAQELSQDRAAAGEIEFDFWDAAPAPSEPTAAGVNLLTVPRDLAVEVAEALHQAKLYCETLDGGPFILTRAAILAGHAGDRSRPVGILDWGRGDSMFVVMLDGQPVFTRVLKNCSAAQLVDAVGRELKLGPEESCRILSTYGVSDRAAPVDDSSIQEHVTELTAPGVHQLKAELSKTFAYLKHQRPQFLPTEVCLIGGGSTIRQIGAKLSGELGVPMSPWSLDCQANASAALRGRPVGLLAQAAALSELGWAA